VLPPEWGDVAHDVGADAEVGGGQGEVTGVPEDHGRHDQVQSGGAVGLVLESAVSSLAELAEEDGAGERVARLALVQSRLGTAAQVQVAQPVQHEHRAFEPSHLSQRNGQAVLPRVSGQAPAAPSWPAIQDLEPNTPCSNAGTSAPSGQRQSTAPDRRPYRAPHTDESGLAQGADRALLRAFSKIAFGFARSGAAQSPAFDE